MLVDNYESLVSLYDDKAIVYLQKFSLFRANLRRRLARLSARRGGARRSPKGRGRRGAGAAFGYLSGRRTQRNEVLF